MSEPEELVIEAAHFATRVARDAWRRYGHAPAGTGLPLAIVRARLELFVTALAGAPIAIAPLESPAPRSWLSRLAASGSRTQPPLCATDGLRVYLRPLLNHPADRERALEIYRLLAVQQALRLVRGSRGVFARIRDPRVGNWFMLAEAAIVDRFVADHVPGLVRTLNEARRRALADRNVSGGRPRPDVALERQVRTLLAGLSDEQIASLPDNAMPEMCRAWAEERAGHDDFPQHVPIALPAYWGSFIDPPTLVVASMTASMVPGDDQPVRKPRTSELRRQPKIREAAEDEDDGGSGTWVIRADEPQESVEDPFGLQRPIDRKEDADPGGLADSLSELPEARIVRTPERPREVLQAMEPSLRTANRLLAGFASHAGIAYPEWDHQRAEYRLPGAIVRVREAPAGDPAWVRAALARHAPLVHRVRTRFERLQPRPVRFFRQVDGADIDIAAYVTGDADRRAGVTMDGRLYVAVRPARRELAVALLLDVSASTDAWVSSTRRIVDLEKEAMLIVCEALDALGDRYALFAFSGEGPDNVVVLPLKRFDERAGSLVRRRIAALDSDRYTRLGAPIRHVTAALCREKTSRRLLLLLTDGKPNDVDAYEGAYGVEDTRRAVAEARRQGVTVFCLTVDREAPRYAGRIFGQSGFGVLRKPDQLPSVVVDVLRQLIRA